MTELTKRLDVLDGLRGIAVLLVLWYHIWEISWYPAPWPWLEFVPETGFVGVHLFFFLSGFVISYPFLRGQFGGKSAPSWLHFYYRRFIKIVPSYLLSMIIAFAIGYAAVVRYGGTPVWQEIATHLLFIHTWWQSTYGSINGVLWTLAVEVEFYAIFPLVWWCFKRNGWVTAAAMIVISLAWRAWTAQCCFNTSMPLLAENLPGYLDIFACGMLCAMLFVRYGSALKTPRFTWSMAGVALIGWVGLVLLLQGMFGYRLHPQWEVAGTLYTRALFGFSFAAIAIGSLCAPRVFQVLVANPPLRFLAIVSYNLYLYHQMIAREMVTWHLPPFAGSDPHFDPHWQLTYTLIALVATIIQAAFVTWVFERPIMRLPEPRLTSTDTGHST
jgi:peptidoglycan/LPS O-acetylase OafA/YrhL